MSREAFIFLGAPTSGKSSLTQYLQETIKGEVILGKGVAKLAVSAENLRELEKNRQKVPDQLFLESLQERLLKVKKDKLIFDNIPRTTQQAEFLLHWFAQAEYRSHAVILEITFEEMLDRFEKRQICPVDNESYHHKAKPPKIPGICDTHGMALERRLGDNPQLLVESLADFRRNLEEIVPILDNACQIYRIDGTSSVADAAKDLFLQLAPHIFQEVGMAKGYYRLREMRGGQIRHIFVAGMSAFIHGVRDDYKDFDILVPDEDIELIASEVNQIVAVKDSSHAYTRSAYVGDSVETISNLAVKVDGQLVPFPFEFFEEKVTMFRFMGMECPFMSVEDLMLLYAGLAREGKDDFGKQKRDLTYLKKLSLKPEVDWQLMKERSLNLGMLTRLQEKLSDVGLEPKW